jgi:hypothetical protein
MQYYLIQKTAKTEFLKTQYSFYQVLNHLIDKLSITKNRYIRMAIYWKNNPIPTTIQQKRAIFIFSKILKNQDRIEERKLYADIDLFISAGYSENSPQIQELYTFINSLEYSKVFKEHNQNIALSTDNLNNAIIENSFYLRGHNRIYHSDTFIMGLKYSRNQLDRIITKLIKKRNSIYN